MTDATVRCESCGARNPAGATWCTQCYAAFGPVDPSEGTPPVPSGTQAGTTAASPTTAPTAPTGGSEGGLADARREVGADAAGDGAGPPSDPPAAVQVGDVREVDGQVEWRCTTCAGWMALESPICTTCGSPRSGFGEVARPETAVSDVDGRQVRTLAALFPGLGHLAVGRVGSGGTRLALGLLWLLGGIWWLVTTSAGGTAPGVILLLGVVVLWLASYVDAVALAAGREERFGVRGLLWSVVGVTGLLMVTVALLATGPSLG